MKINNYSNPNVRVCVYDSRTNYGASRTNDGASLNNLMNVI